MQRVQLSVVHRARDQHRIPELEEVAQQQQAVRERIRHAAAVRIEDVRPHAVEVRDDRGRIRALRVLTERAESQGSDR